MAISSEYMLLISMVTILSYDTVCRFINVKNPQPKDDSNILVILVQLLIFSICFIAYGIYNNITELKVSSKPLPDPNEEQLRKFRAAIERQDESLIKEMVELYPALHLYDMVLPGGNGVLHFAVAQKNHDLIRYWLSHGVSPNQNNATGDTPLHITTRLNDAEAASFLMKCGAKVDILNHKMQTALTIATTGRYTEIIDVLSKNISEVMIAGKDKTKRSPSVSPVVSTEDLVISEDEASSAVFTQEEVSKHDNLENGVWVIIGGGVYDITKFIEARLHPSTNAFIEPYFGKDATEAYDAAFHSIAAGSLLKKYEIGALAEQEIRANKGNLSSMSLRPSMSILAAAKRNTDNMFINKLYIFPVKGCGGIRVESAQLTSFGFVDDRIYAFVNKKTNIVINQLTFTRLALLKTAFKSGTDNCDAGIQINDMFVPFRKENTLKVEWRSCLTPFLVYDQGETISKWITSYLAPDADPGDEFLLVRLHEANHRQTAEYFSLPFAAKPTQEMSAIQNYGHVNLGSEESLAELNRRYKLCADADELGPQEEKTIEFDRFRCNIVLSGVPLPHYEDFMKHIKFGEDGDDEKPVEILWTRRRYYCAVPLVNQKTALRTAEPQRTQLRYRNAMTLNDRTCLPGDEAVFFGSFYQVKHNGVVRVGQSVHSLYDKFDFDTLRTAAGKSYFGLTDANIGSQFALDYFSQYEKFQLVLKEQVNHNVIRVRFDMILEHKHYHQSLKQAIKMGDHYLLKYTDDENNDIIRPYTPVFDEKNPNEMSFDLLIKVYDLGKMSSHVNNMAIGQTILCKKNYGKVCYLEPGKLRFGDPRFTMFLPYTLNVTKLNLIAGGSGITPILQIVSGVHKNREMDKTQIVLFYANVAEEDILCKEELIEMTKTNSNIKIHFVVEKLNVGVRGIEDEFVHKGWISMEMCTKHFFPPNKERNDVVTLLCGPPPMEHHVKNYIAKMGHDEKFVSAF